MKKKNLAVFVVGSALWGLPMDAAQWTMPKQSLDMSGDESRGDWFKKRNILKKARVAHEQIQEKVQGVGKLQSEYAQKYQPDVERFQKEISTFDFSQEDIIRVLTDSEKSIKILREQESPLTDIERQRLLDLSDLQKTLGSFQEEFEYLLNLKTGLERALSVLKEQAERAEMYEQQAWKNYEQIDEVFDHQKAQRLLDEMQTAIENIDSIKTYITGDLRTSLETMPIAFNTQFSDVTKAKDALVEQGVVFKEPVKVAEPEIVLPEKEAEKPAESGWAWWQWPLVPFIRLWQWIKSLFG